MATSREDKINLFAKFIASGECDSNGEAAVKAGWSESRKHVTASELMKDPKVVAKIEAFKQIKNDKKDIRVDSEKSVQELFEENIQDMIIRLKDSKPKEFLDMYLKFQKGMEEEEGEYHGYSIEQLLEEIDSVNEEIDTIKGRINTELGEGEV